MSEQKELGEKFIEAWSEIDNPELDSENPHFKNKYASLKSTLKVIREVCKRHNIAYLQKLVKNEDGSYNFCSSIADGSGSIEVSTFPIDAPPNPQAFGSNCTYAKRQQAQADWGITGEIDDDGNAGAQAAQKMRSGSTARAANPAHDDARAAAKKRCYLAMVRFQELTGGSEQEAKDLYSSLERMPGFEDTVEFYTTKAVEYEQMCGET